MPLAYQVYRPDLNVYSTLFLDPVQQLGYEQVPVWDGPTYLYTIHRFHFRGTYNPATFAYDLAGRVGPAYVAGSLPPTSNNATRHFLMQPRGTFVYNIGGVLVPGVGINGGIEAAHFPPQNISIPGTNANPNGQPITIGPNGLPINPLNPAGGFIPVISDLEQYPCDAANGPTPLHCNVVEVKGTKTFLVDWAIESYVNESYRFQSSQSLSALLSHLWTVEEDLDQDFFATRTITGHAIFRSDRLLALGTAPDDYRAWLFHPVQKNFKRNVQQVIPSSDGLRLDYVLVDRENAFNLLSNNTVNGNVVPAVVGLGVTRIEATYTHGYRRQVGLEQASGNALIGLAEAAIAFGLIKKIPLAGFLEAERAVDHLGRLADAIPIRSQHLVCRVWGNRSSTRANLYKTAVAVLAAKVSTTSAILGAGVISVTEDLMGKFIELDAEVSSGPIESLYIAGGSLFPLPVVGPDELANVTQSAPVDSLGRVLTQPQAPYDNGARENAYSAIAQVLAEPFTVTPQANNDRYYATTGQQKPASLTP